MSEFETWPATPVEASLKSMQLLFTKNLTAGVPSQGGTAGVGGAFERQSSPRSKVQSRQSEVQGPNFNDSRLSTLDSRLTTLDSYDL